MKSKNKKKWILDDKIMFLVQLDVVYTVIDEALWNRKNCVSIENVKIIGDNIGYKMETKVDTEKY